MTRERKFRAWNKDKKEWAFLYIGKGSAHTLSHTQGEHEDWQQYTGLKDKNGKEIYESDYLEGGVLNTWCVFWGSGKYILQNISTGDIIDLNEKIAQTNEVVGNRYENPREHKAMASDL